MILAVTKSYGLGKDNKLPWNVPSDFKHFKETTWGRTLVVGKKTFEGMPKLKGRHFIVVSKDNPIRKEIVDGNIVIGGRQVYLECLRLGLIDKIICTHLDLDTSCDVFMPADFLDGFSVIETKYLEGNHKVCTYVKNDQRGVAFA
jgi:dihydrofolate reductase